MKSLFLSLLLLLGAVAAASAAIIQPRPVDNRRDPHDGEPFEWEPVDDDPWPGPSFTFPRLPSIDEVDILGGGRPSSPAEVRVRAALLMQVLRAIFNNAGVPSSFANSGNSGSKPVSSNEVVPGPAAPAWSQQRVNEQLGSRSRAAQ